MFRFVSVPVSVSFTIGESVRTSYMINPGCHSTRLNSRFLQQQEIHALKEMKSSLPNIWEILISEQIVTVEYQSGGLGMSSQG